MRVFWDNWEPSERVSVLSTLGAAGLSCWVAFLSPASLPIQAIASGALGGLIHEIAQSGGKIFFLQKRDDGLNLGSLAGMALGSVAGIIVLQGYLAPPTACPAKLSEAAKIEACQAVEKQQKANTSLLIEMFLAGLALKGVSQAAASSEKTPPANALKLSSEDTISVNKELKVKVQALSSKGETLPSYRGTVSFKVEPEDNVRIPSATTFTEANKGTVEVQFLFSKSGEYTIIATDATLNVSTQKKITVT